MSEERCEKFDGDIINLVSKVELVFDVPCYLSDEHYKVLREAMHAIVEAPYNQLKNGVHWASSEGSRPNFSQADSIFLGQEVDPNAPESGEPTFDDDILQFASSSRSFLNEKEKTRVLKRRNKRKTVCTCSYEDSEEMTNHAPLCPIDLNKI